MTRPICSAKTRWQPASAGAFIGRLRSLQRHGKLKFAGPAVALAAPAAWAALMTRLHQTKWIVYPKPTARNPEQALDYLVRYTHRVAISDHRILRTRRNRPRGRSHVAPA